MSLLTENESAEYKQNLSEGYVEISEVLDNPYIKKDHLKVHLMKLAEVLSTYEDKFR